MNRFHHARAMVLLLAVLLASACSGNDQAVPGSTSPRTNVDVASPTNTRVAETGAIYAAVIRQLVTVDHGFGGASSPYRHVYVLNGVVPGAADPMHLVRRPLTPFTPNLVQAISAKLHGLPPVTFVPQRGTVISGSGPGHVIHAGVLITLGRITWRDHSTASVANNRWATGLNGQWLRYLVRKANGTWHVTGVASGTVAIS